MKENTIDYVLRTTWLAVTKMYNEQAIKFDSTMATGFTLLNIDPEQGTPSTSLGPKMGMEATSLSRILKTMEERGLIERKPNPDDAPRSRPPVRARRASRVVWPGRVAANPEQSQRQRRAARHPLPRAHAQSLSRAVRPASGLASCERQVENGALPSLEIEETIQGVVPKGCEVSGGVTCRFRGEVDALADATRFDQQIAIPAVAQGLGGVSEMTDSEEGDRAGPRLVLAQASADESAAQVGLPQQDESPSVWLVPIEAGLHVCDAVHREQQLDLPGWSERRMADGRVQDPLEHVPLHRAVAEAPGRASIADAILDRHLWPQRLYRVSARRRADAVLRSTLSGVHQASVRLIPLGITPIRGRVLGLRERPHDR